MKSGKYHFFAGGFLGKAASYATKKFIRKNLKNIPKIKVDEKKQPYVNLYRKAKVAEQTHQDLSKVGINIFGPKLKTKSHLKRAEGMGRKLLKDQNKLETMVEVLKKKQNKLLGKKDN